MIMFDTQLVVVEQVMPKSRHFSGWIGAAGTFWLYTVLNVAFIGVTFWLIPETKNVSLGQPSGDAQGRQPVVAARLTLTVTDIAQLLARHQASPDGCRRE
jgi:hypothetical protein